MIRPAALALALLAAGCAAPASTGEPVVPDLRIDCDRVRMAVPERLRGSLAERQKCNLPPFLVTVEGLEIHVREDMPRIDVGGDDLSVVAEGGVRLTRRQGAAEIEEGPYQVVIFRNGNILRR